MRCAPRARCDETKSNSYAALSTVVAGCGRGSGKFFLHFGKTFYMSRSLHRPTGVVLFNWRRESDPGNVGMRDANSRRVRKADRMKRKFIFGTFSRKELYPMNTSRQCCQVGVLAATSLLESSDVVESLRRIVQHLHERRNGGSAGRLERAKSHDGSPRGNGRSFEFEWN